jgi:hypothetical protein
MIYGPFLGIIAQHLGDDDFLMRNPYTSRKIHGEDENQGTTHPKKRYADLCATATPSGLVGFILACPRKEGIGEQGGLSTYRVIGFCRPLFVRPHS